MIDHFVTSSSITLGSCASHCSRSGDFAQDAARLEGMAASC